MRRTLALGLAGAVLVFAAAAHATIRPQRGMSGVALGMTKAQVRARLGSPIGSGGGRFYYARVWVGFRLGHAVEITTTRSTERTASGVGVDSSESEVRRSYPSVVCAPSGGFRRCRLGSGKPGTRATDFLLGHGHVLQVTVQLLSK
ncbi:MAG: outer membrane protein assembly factor BamE [Actinobacteria bacterium]|nr:MAG: outer membrane protein assembly factor BamE [Actinomycetota bacterium]